MALPFQTRETLRRPANGRAAHWYAHCAWVQNRGSPLGGCLGFARRCVRGIFRHVHAATKNDLASFRRRRRRKPGRGFGPFLDLARDGGTGDEGPRSAACFCWECLLSAWPWSGFGGGRGRCGGRTGEGKLMEIRTEENGNFTFSKPYPIDEIVGAWYII